MFDSHFYLKYIKHLLKMSAQKTTMSAALEVHCSDSKLGTFKINVKTHSYTVPVKSLDTPNHSRVFLYLDYFLHCRIIEKTSKR